MGLSLAQRNELIRIVTDTLDNQFAFFARPLILSKLDEKARAIPPWLRDTTVGELADAYLDLRGKRRIR